MALYNQVDFKADIYKHNFMKNIKTDNVFNLSLNQSEELCNIVIATVISHDMSWGDFVKSLSNILVEYIKKLKPEYELPKRKRDIGLYNLQSIQKIKSYEEIISYLSVIKGEKVEENLKNHFLISLVNDEEYNHFAQLFYKYHEMSHKQQKAFLCLCAELIITQEITRTMLDWIIVTFSKVCKGGIDKNIEVCLSGRKKDFYIKLTDRITFLRLLYSITIISPGDDKTTAIKQIKDVLLAVLGNEDFNPRSFVEMCYYYAILNLLSMENLRNMLINTATNVILVLFSDKISTVCREKVAEQIKLKTLANTESFLNFNENSISFCAEIIHHFDSEISNNEVKAIVEDKLKEMHVNYFENNTYDRKTNTYEYYINEIEPLMDTYAKEYKNEAEFSKWIAEHRRFYEGYYNIESRTRSISIYGNRNPGFQNTIDDFAYFIVHKDLLCSKIKGYNGINKNYWEYMTESMQSENRYKEIKDVLDKVFKSTTTYKGNNPRIKRIKAYKEINIDLLTEAISIELSKPIEEKYAIEIVHFDSMSDLIKKILHNESNEKWQNQIIKYQKHRSKILTELFSKLFIIISPSKDRMDSTPEIGQPLIRKAKKYAGVNVDKMKLIQAILKELENYPYVENSTNNVTVYAREIVHNHSLSSLRLPGYSGLGTTQWKNRFRNIDNKTERISELKKFFYKEFFIIKTCLDALDDINAYSEIQKCVHIGINEIDSLVSAINDELFRQSTSRIKRIDYLLDKFKIFAVSNETAVDFEMELSDDESEMQSMRWAGFDETRYHDAMLYMCLNCDYPIDNCNNPMEMYEKINATPGYGYYENE